MVDHLFFLLRLYNSGNHNLSMDTWLRLTTTVNTETAASCPMKKIPIIAALAIAAIMLVEPIGAASTSSDFNYTVNPIAIQLSPDTILPQGLPLCRSASLGNIVCYSPKFIKKAYGFPSTATLDGSGQTMVIVDAFGSPTIAADLARFDTMFG